MAGLLLAVAPAPVAAQANLPAMALAEICLPYANRQQSFEKAIRTARDLRFRRPADDRAPLEEWASEVEMVSRDGTLRLRLEESSVDIEDRSAYAVTCSISSNRISARELANLGRRAFRNERYWRAGEGEGTSADRAWDRLSREPDVYQLRVRVQEETGTRPALVIQGLYF